MSSTPSVLNPTIVQAGAGTGKTESLARRIIEVAQLIHEKKQGTPKLVATTFTERATSELRERVVSILSQVENPPTWLVDFVQDTEALHISTIHGTLSLILHRFGQLLGLDPDFTIISTRDERELLSRSLRKLISKNESYGLLLEQYTFKELIGATGNLIRHYRLHGSEFRVATGWREILEKDLKELKGVLSFLKSTTDLSALPPKLAEKVQLLITLQGRLQNENDVEIARSIFNEVLGGVSKPAVKEGARGSEIKESLDFIFALKKGSWELESTEPLVNLHHDENAKVLTELVKEASERIQVQKKELGVLSFDDLEFLTWDLVTQYPDAADSIRREWDFWFLDEYQDTSPLQKKLLFSFFRTPWNAYFVGDPQQSIYLFRGADENVFQDTKKVISENNGSVERLSTNYRSHPDLLKFLNATFQSMKTPLEVLEPRPEKKEDSSQSASSPDEDKRRAQIFLAGKECAEESLIAEQILNWHKEGRPFHDMAVLVRTNDKARNVAQYLSALGVPVYIHATGGYYDRREVLDALALLSFLEDPADDELFVLLARSPWMMIEDTTLAQWGMARKKLSFWEYLRVNEDERQKYPTLALLHDGVKKAETQPLSTVFENLIESLGLYEFCLITDASGRSEANLRKLLWSLRKAESSPEFSAAEYIENAWRELVEDSEEVEAASFIEPKRVNIMTIHKSKGLKFKCVVVPFCGDLLRTSSPLLELAPDGRWAMRVLSAISEDKVSPLMHAQLKEERSLRELAEASRVFYVAITRAADKLCLVGSETIRDKSWLSFSSLSFSEGEYDTYRVKTFNESLVHEKLAEETYDIDQRRLSLPGHLVTTTSRLNVTQLVKARVDLQEKAYNESLVGRPDSAKVSKISLSSFQRQLESQQYGQAVHYVFEQLHVTPNIDLKKLATLSQKRFGAQQTIDANVIEKTMNLTTPPLRKLVNDGFVEWPFTVLVGDISLKGQIDLWGDVGDETWIIDYKSAKNLSQDLVTKAHEQLELYALAIHKTGRPWERIKLAIVTPLLQTAQVLPLASKEDVIRRLKPLQIDNWGEAEI